MASDVRLANGDDAAAIGQLLYAFNREFDDPTPAPSALAERIRQDRREGATPVAAVATAGTTGTGAIDPLAAIAAVCSREQIWFHVDACYGGAAVLSEVLRPRLAGIDVELNVVGSPAVQREHADRLALHGDAQLHRFGGNAGQMDVLAAGAVL